MPQGVDRIWVHQCCIPKTHNKSRKRRVYLKSNFQALIGNLSLGLMTENSSPALEQFHTASNRTKTDPANNKSIRRRRHSIHGEPCAHLLQYVRVHSKKKLNQCRSNSGHRISSSVVHTFYTCNGWMLAGWLVIINKHHHHHSPLQSRRGSKEKRPTKQKPKSFQSNRHHQCEPQTGASQDAMPLPRPPPRRPLAVDRVVYRMGRRLLAGRGMRRGTTTDGVGINEIFLRSRHKT